MVLRVEEISRLCRYVEARYLPLDYTQVNRNEASRSHSLVITDSQPLSLQVGGPLHSA